MTQRVLWLDNDPAYINPYQEMLEDLKYAVTVVTTVSEAGTAARCSSSAEVRW